MHEVIISLARARTGLDALLARARAPLDEWLTRARFDAVAVRVFVSCAVWAACAPGALYAQPFAPTINPNAAPIVVSQQPEKIALRPKAENQTLINIAFGATVNDGNSKLFAGNLGGRLGLIRSDHQLTFEALGSMGGARESRLTKVEWNSRSMIARLRYDMFLSRADALFVAMAPRRDKSAGFNLRLQNQVGYLRNLFHRGDAHRFWSELGYDLTYDNFAPVDKTVPTNITDQVRNVEATTGISLAPEGATVTSSVTTRTREPNQWVHSARLFLGYTNRLLASATVSVGAETLLDFTDAKNVRVNGLAELTSSITGSFKLGIQSRVMFDNKPVPGTKPYDTILAVQLAYTFDSLHGALNTPCPVCDCTAQVEAVRAACRATIR